jgi:hypothetical protein
MIHLSAQVWAISLILTTGVWIHAMVAQATIDIKRVAAFSTAYNIAAITMITFVACSWGMCGASAHAFF